MKKVLIIICAILILFVVSEFVATSRFLPERCNVGSEFNCEKYWMRPNGTVGLVFTNNIGLTITQVNIINASWAEETIGPEKCEDISANIYGPGEDIEIICYFKDTPEFPPVGARIKIQFDMTYIPKGQTYLKPLIAEVYGSISKNRPGSYRTPIYLTSNFIFYVIFCILLLALYIFIIKKVTKLKKMKPWIRDGLKAHFIAAIVILIIFNFYVIMDVINGILAHPEFFMLGVGALIISFLFAIILYIPVTIISHIRHKLKKRGK